MGEVLIVIVGVGIALGAESWWTGRQDLARETEHMLALRSNFEENVDSLRGAIENHRGIQRSAAALMSIANGLDASPGADSLRALAWNAFSVFGFSPVKAAYDNLLSTGDLQLLRDAQLRRLLARFQSQIEMEEGLNWQWEQWNQVNQPFVNQHMEALDWAPRDLSWEIPLPAAVVPTDWAALLSNREFRNILFQRYIAANDTKTGWLMPLLETAEGITSRLDALLDRSETGA